MLPGAGLAASLRPVFVGFISLKTIPLFVMQRFASLVRYAWILTLALGAFHVSSSPARAEKCGDATRPRPGGSLSSLAPGPPVAVGVIRDRVLTMDATPIVRFGVARYFADPLEAPHPNPFNPVTTIRYELADEGPIRLMVYDLLGRRVAVLADGLQESGEHTVRFEASHLSTGLYFVILDAAGQTFTKSILLMK